MFSALVSVRRRLTVAAAALVITVGSATTAAAQPSPQAELDAVHDAGMPGILASVRDGAHTWTGSAGVADMRTGRPLHPNSHHRVGSITKTFTAVAVLQQVGAGRIELDAPVGDYLPELLPGERGDTVTVRMLLNHTSGIGDYDTILFDSLLRGSLADLEANRWRYRRAEEIATIGLEAPPTNAPGERWSYSNTNYVLTGLLLEKVTGHDAEDYITERIIRPLRLRNTYFPGGLPFILGPHGKAYEALYRMPEQPGEYSVYNMTWAGTAGALISTTEDLNTFYRALLSGRLLAPDLLAQMKRTVPILDARGNEIGRYGLGLRRIDAGACGTLWGHDGVVFGMSTLSLHSADGSRQLTYGLNMTKYQQLGPDGVPVPGPIDAALGRVLEKTMCRQAPGQQVSVRELRTLTAATP
ncbi:D-alanyl-D-alanine carboxypeptidase [Halopolyspora algeriensis]|uniref:D-alanyl-D-alanine carboxypeptidase n=1 Tax=Halopolyspora algeriensis TaxID=1500506 RepID=A0A368VIA3_9ACTN|nr:serine hydrolase domain-containing protein [Halopolyspora algeriensis]RCW39929.1 D-alanyl-D-alanine carboxypeptidase [Halopolyspora algeriensis]TQM46634.1 D-alanyl-D-alanine carboxypeptidase [Halopolyspora algeriensis]